MDDYDRVKQALPLQDYCEARLERRGANTYVCPACGSGTHGNRTAAFVVDTARNRFKCFSCGASGDLFDLIGIVEGIESRSAQLKYAAEYAGVMLDETAGKRGAVSPSKAISSTATAKVPRETGQEPQDGYDEGRERHRRFIEWARGNLGNPEAVAYLSSRGFDVAQARAMGMGYDPEHRRIVLPWRGCDYYHVDRSIDRDGDHKYDKPKAAEVGAQPLYNREVVRSGRPFFVVEGVLDALAVEAAGYEAVALAGVSYRPLLDALRGVSAARCVVMLDDDERGVETAGRLEAALDELGVEHIRYAYRAEGAKDPADEHAGHAADVAAWYDEALATLDEQSRNRAEKKHAAVLESLEVRDPAQVAAALFMGECDDLEPIGTGLRELDDALGGGLPSCGLVVLGAMSSTGKTTLCVQVADYIAAHGRPVLFVTIEQSAAEIVAKSLSRMTSARTRRNGAPLMLSAQHIMSRRGRAEWEGDGEKQAAFYRACEEYSAAVAPRLRILETEAQPNVSRLETVMRAMEKHDGEAPVLFVDYLQILAPMNDRDTDKRNMDANVTALRQLARDLCTCIVVVSTLNRSSYDGGISLDSYKESGAIEYGADVLMGLQPRGVDDVANDARKKQEQRAAEILSLQAEYRTAKEKHAEVVVLKNRNGGTPKRPAALDFDAMVNTFKDARTAKAAPSRN